MKIERGYRLWDDYRLKSLEPRGEGVVWKVFALPATSQLHILPGYLLTQLNPTTNHTKHTNHNL